MQPGGVRPEPGVAAARPLASPHHPCYQGSAEAAACCKRGRLVLGPSHPLPMAYLPALWSFLTVWVCRISMYNQGTLLMLLLLLAQTMRCRILQTSALTHYTSLAFTYVIGHFAQTKHGKPKTQNAGKVCISPLWQSTNLGHKDFQASAAMLLCRWPCTVICMDTQGSMAHSCMAVSKHQAHR